MSGVPFNELFPPVDYRFRVGVRRGDAERFFAPTAEHDVILAERRRWLETAPERYAQITERGRPLLAAFHSLVTSWEHAGGPAADGRALGAALEPDFLLLAPDRSGLFRLEGGALCFPTGWSLEEKLGATIDTIHGVVPGLNAALGPAISRVLAGLSERDPLERVNWGLAATAERNLHPALHRPRLHAESPLAEIWLRGERQLLAALPGSTDHGVLFAIRIELTPLPQLLADHSARSGFVHALNTMPDDVAAYKGLAAVRPRLLKLAT